MQDYSSMKYCNLVRNYKNSELFLFSLKGNNKGNYKIYKFFFKVRMEIEITHSISMEPIELI